MKNKESSEKTSVEIANNIIKFLNEGEQNPNFYENLAKYILVKGKGFTQRLDANLKNYCDRVMNELQGNPYLQKVENDKNNMLDSNFLEGVSRMKKRLTDYKEQLKKVDSYDEFLAEHMIGSVLNEMESTYGITEKIIEDFLALK